MQLYYECANTDFLKHCPNDMHIVITQLFTLTLDTGMSQQTCTCRSNLSNSQTIVELLC